MAAPLLIRADASTQIGTGHVMRCLALAQRWRATGGTAVFACCELTPALARRLENEGMEIVRLDATTGSESDATQALALAARLGAKWIAADGYAFGSAWQRQVAGDAFKLLVIDDYGHAEHYFADIVLNQNASASAAPYEKREAHTRLLLGNKYTLLREEFLTARPGPHEIPARARKILVTLGGGDPDDVTSMVIDALATLSDIEVTVVVGGSNPHLEKLQRAVAQHAASMRLVVNATNMPDLMAWADLAISAAGSTSWELAFFGVPSALVVAADNQLGIASSLNIAGFSLDLGRHTATSPQKIASAIAPFLEEAARRREMSARGRQLVDGHGARRVAAALGAPLTITLISDEHSWLNASLDALKSTFEHAGHRVRWVHRPADIEEGDIAFLLSLGQIVPASKARSPTVAAGPRSPGRSSKAKTRFPSHSSRRAPPWTVAVFICKIRCFFRATSLCTNYAPPKPRPRSVSAAPSSNAIPRSPVKAGPSKARRATTRAAVPKTVASIPTKPCASNSTSCASPTPNATRRFSR